MIYIYIRIFWKFCKNVKYQGNPCWPKIWQWYIYNRFFFFFFVIADANRPFSQVHSVYHKKKGKILSKISGSRLRHAGTSHIKSSFGGSIGTSPAPLITTLPPWAWLSSGFPEVLSDWCFSSSSSGYWGEIKKLLLLVGEILDHWS